MFKEMQYVYAVYQEKSFSRAATRLMISQPALSVTIRKIEATLGITLFDRSTSPISVTQAGEYYIRSIEQIFAIQKNMDQYFQNMAHVKTGKISIGAPSFFCSYILPDIIIDFKKQYPGIDVELTEGSVPSLSEALQKDLLEMAIFVGYEMNNDLESISCGQELMLLAVPASYSINRHLQDYRLTFSDIQRRKHLSPSCPTVHASQFKEEPFLLLRKGNDIYSRAISICRDAGFAPHVAMYLDQQLTSFHLACADLGICFIRSSIVNYVNPDQKIFFYRLDNPLVFRDVFVSFRKNRSLSFAAEEFLKILCKKTNL